MSEQFAMQPDEFESTNTRLDSILDRLNALGDSAAEMKVAPLRPLQSVPDLDPSVIADKSAVEVTPPAMPPLGLVPPVVPAAEAPSPAPAPETVVEQQAPVEVTPVVESIADVAPVTEAATGAPVEQTIEHPVEAPLTELTVVDAAIAEPVVEAPLVEPPVVADASTVFAAPVEAPVEQAVVEPAMVEPTQVEPAPVEVEYHDFALAPSEDEPAAELVFELENIIEPTQSAPVETPEAPTSIFGLGALGGDTAPTAEADVQSDDPDGWVSYHESTSAFDAPAPEVATTIEPAADPVEVFEEPEFGRVEESTFGEPQWGDEQVEESVPVDSESLFDLASDVVDEPAADTGFDAFAAMDNSDTPVEIAGIDMVSPHLMAETEPVVEDADLYSSDEELPLPDFTGVYADQDTDDAFWGTDNVPDPVESGSSGVSVGRDELDKLRPLEEAAVEEEVESASVTVKLQLLGVILFGLLAFLAVWAQDPNMLNDMLDSIRNLISG